MPQFLGKEEIRREERERDKAGEKTVSLFSAMGRAKTVSCMWRSDHSVNHSRKHCGQGLPVGYVHHGRTMLFLLFFCLSFLFLCASLLFPCPKTTQITPSPGGDTRISIDMRYFYLTHVRQHNRLTLPSPPCSAASEPLMHPDENPFSLSTDHLEICPPLVTWHPAWVAQK